MKRTALFLSLLTAFLKFAQAQPALGIFSNSISVTPSDTVHFNDLVTITFYVVNTGNAPFNGTFIDYYKVDSTFLGALDSMSNFLLNAGDSIQEVIQNHEISPTKYAIGDNIVVIWPVAVDANVTTSDSGTTHIYVDTPLAVGPPILREQIRVFYKNGGQGLYIDYGSMISQINDVSCYSLLGQQTRKYNYAVNEISFAENSPQIFLLVIRTKEGEVITFKILRI